jgi:hypothetical protein
MWTQCKNVSFCPFLFHFCVPCLMSSDFCFHFYICTFLLFQNTLNMVWYFSCGVWCCRLQDGGSHGFKSFFTEIIASISDIKFSNDGRHILSRDYMNLKVLLLNWAWLFNSKCPSSRLCHLHKIYTIHGFREWYDYKFLLQSVFQGMVVKDFSFRSSY